MLLGVISDTHGMAELTRKAVELFISLKVDEIIHCGDVGTHDVIQALSVPGVPVHYVCGNTDSSEYIRNGVIKYGQTWYGNVGMIQREGVHIAFLHGNDWSMLEELLYGGRFRLICCGHSHQAEFSIHGETYLLNPGALFRVGTPTVATVKVPEMTSQRYTIK